MPTRQPRPRPRAPTAPRLAFRAAAVLLACLGASALQAAAPYRGRSVDSVLEELAATASVQLVYTSAVVPATAIVGSEPSAGPALEAIAQILAPLGLELQRIEGRVYSVVPARESKRAPTAAPAVPADPREEPIADVVVTASRYSLASDVPEVHAFLSQDELEALPRLAEDALKAVHRLPGAASNGLAGLAHMRGGDANETQVLLDGLPLYEPFHLRLLQSPASVLDERIIDGLDVYAGGFTSEYGDRMSAIIDARSLRPAADAYYELGLSLMHTNALASHRFADGRGQWLASIRRSNLGDVADILNSDLGEPKYVDGFGRVDYEWSPSTRGSLHLLLANDHAEITNSAGTEHAIAKYSNAYLWGTLTHEWSNRLNTTALVSFTDVSAERKAEVLEPGKRIGNVDDERDYDVLGFKLDASYTTDRWLQRAGIDVRKLAATYDYTGSVDFASDYPYPDAPAQDISRALEPRPSGEHLAMYYTVRGRLTDALTAELGLRWDEETYGVDSDNQLAPRLNVAWRLNDATRLLANWGRYQQYQGIEELPVEDGVTDFAPAQRADHFILGLERDLTPAYALRLEAYRKNYDRLAHALREPVRPAVTGTRIDLGPRRDFTDVGRGRGRRDPAHAQAGRRVERLVRVRVVARGGSRRWQRRAAQLGPDAHAERWRALVVRAVAGNARGAVPHRLARHADRARCAGQRRAGQAQRDPLRRLRFRRRPGELRMGAVARHVDRAWRADQRIQPAQPLLYRHRVRAERWHTDAGPRTAALAAARALGRRAVEVLEPQPTPCWRNQSRHAAQPAAASSAR